LLALGYPLALVTLGVSTHGLGLGPVPAWVWLLPLAALLPLYPVQAWRDAPLFPTPRDGLRGLAGVVALPEGARVLDAGCGTGDGLLALARELPRARLEGTERSTPLAALARRRCRGASVRRGDMWADDWHGLDLVYLFQRPETMPRAWAKACAQMAPGRWLVSLEFPVPGQRAAATLAGAGRRSVHVYRVPGPAAAEGAAAAANSTQASASRRSRAARSRR
jgi:SAM-dependent methyltransferase